jgi:predicted dehydrogenase
MVHGRGIGVSRRVSCGVIGLGGFGWNLCKALKKIDTADLRYVSDIKENVTRKIGSELSAVWYSDYRKMLSRKDLEAVFIATPNHLHAEPTVAALEAGKHVLCTKPIATTLKDADDMIRMAKKTSMKLEIGYNRRFDKPIVKTKELLDSKIIGRVFYARASLMQIRPHIDLDIPGRPPANEYWKWMGKKIAGGGSLITHHSHELDYMRWFLGPVDWVMGRTDTLFHSIEVEDVASAIIKFKNGALLSFNSTTAAMASESPTYEIFGDMGAITANARNRDEIHDQVYPDEIMVCDRTRKWKIVSRGRTDWFKQQVEELSKFLECIIEDKDPLIPGEEGKKTLEVVLGIYKSSKLGRLVKLPLSHADMQTEGS